MNANLNLNEARTTRAHWDAHYTRDRSRQSYPDENLVRLLSKLEPGPALDLGCGSGRHLALLADLGYGPIYGCDSSANAVELCRERYPGAEVFVVAPEGASFLTPLCSASLAAVVAWGVLHYNSPEEILGVLAETGRLLAPGGKFLGTLRAAGDSHFSSNGDMLGAAIRFFSESEARGLLEGAGFTNVQLGYAERAPVGELNRRICHWIFSAERPQSDRLL
jgi:SAM-dependent methyltransferase